MRARIVGVALARALLAGFVTGFLGLATGTRLAHADGLHAPAPEAPAVPADVLLDRLREAARQERGASGDDQWAPADEQSLRLRASDEEILYREASFASARAKDPAVERRLRALASQLDAGQVGEDLATADRPPEAEARRRGLDRRDLVLRRYLVESMRLALATPPPDWRPSEEQIQAWYDEHRAELSEPARITLTQIFFSRARRGERARVDAATLRERLEREESPPTSMNAAPADRGTRIESLGDPFPRGNQARGTEAELERAFGGGFGAAVARAGDAAIGGWIGPVESATGAHLVWVKRFEPGRTKRIDEVRTRALLELRRAEGARLYRERLDELRARYAGTSAMPIFPGSDTTLPPP